MELNFCACQALLDFARPPVHQSSVVTNVQLGKARNPLGNDQIHHQRVNIAKFLVGEAKELTLRRLIASAQPVLDSMSIGDRA